MILSTDTRAQRIGVDICACQPSVYEFTFDFLLACDDFNVTGPGISEFTCFLNFEGENVTDVVPVAVSRVEILELDQLLQVVAQTQINGDFRSGDIFQYTSITATETDMLNASSIPRGFQLSITGRNAVEQTIVNDWAVLYDNDCGIFPVVTEGMVAGWTIFVSCQCVVCSAQYLLMIPKRFKSHADLSPLPHNTVRPWRPAGNDLPPGSFTFRFPVGTRSDSFSLSTFDKPAAIDSYNPRAIDGDIPRAIDRDKHDALHQS